MTGKKYMIVSVTIIFHVLLLSAAGFTQSWSGFAEKYGQERGRMQSDVESVDLGHGKQKEFEEEPKASKWQIENGNLEKFRNAYNFAGKPKLVIYFNRSLSDRISQWDAKHRSVSMEKDEVGEINSNGLESTWTKQQRKMAMEQHKTQQPYQTRLHKDWAWEFENTFVDNFLKASCRLVDRNLMLRLGGTDSNSDILDQNVLEIESLRKYGDIVIEISVIRNSRSPDGYELQVQAKELQSGMLLAYVTSIPWERVKKEIVHSGYMATENGYKYYSYTEKIKPTVNDRANRLARELMEELVMQWGANGKPKKMEDVSDVQSFDHKDVL